MTAITVRPSTPPDAAAILTCLEEAFAPFRDAYTADAFADTVLTPETIAARFTTMTILVATTPDGSIIGTIAAGIHAREGHLRGMAVTTTWQGRGVAQQLLRAAESLLGSRGCVRVTLDTTAPLTRAIAFYLHNGYKSTGRVQDFYGMPLHEFAKDLTPSQPR
jgi:ribosomal protein S18 acetylase RimI-like enzyme